MRFNRFAHIFLMTFVVSSLFGQSSWTQTQGPEGGYVKDLIRAKNGNFVAATLGHVYFSENNGESWIRSSDVPKDVDDLAIDAEGTLYATNWILWKSDDNGVSWSLLSSEKSFVHVTVLKNNTILAGTYSDGIFMSTDAGVHWTAVNHGITTPIAGRVSAFAENADGSAVYAAINNDGVYKSTDGGQNWVSVATFGNVMAMFSTSTDTLYVGNYPDGIHCSGDGGATWFARNVGGSFSFVSSFFEDQGGTILVGTQTNVGIYQWTGTTWVLEKPANLQTPVNCFIPRNSTSFFIGTAGQGIGFDDTGTMVFNTIGFNNTSINALAVMNGSTLLAATDRSGLFRSDDGGQIWHNILLNDYPACQVNDVKWDNKDKRIYACMEYDGIYYQTPSEGNTWTALNDGLPVNRVNKLAIDTISQIKYAGCGSGEGIYRLDMGTTTWEHIDNGILFGDNETITAFLLGSGDSLYMGTSNNYDRIGLFVSPDHGENWVAFNAGLPAKSYITSLAQDQNGTLYAGLTNYYNINNTGIYKYDTSQAKWVYFGLSGNNIHDLIVSRQNRLFVTTQYDVKVFNPVTGAFERAFEYSLGETSTALAITTNQHLYAGTQNSGVYGSDKTVLYQNHITFKVDMNVQLGRDLFDPTADKIQLQGNFTNWETGWDMTDQDQNGIFELTSLIDGSPGDTAYYRFMIYKDNGIKRWEGIPVRKLVLTGEPVSLFSVFFNDNDGTNPFINLKFGDISNDELTSAGAVWVHTTDRLAPDAFILTDATTNNFYKNGSSGLMNFTAGELQNENLPSHSATVGDYDNDGLPDIAISNASSSVNYLYHNNGSYQFVINNTGPISQGNYESRAISWVDYDNDGWLDLFVANGNNSVNNLFRNSGNGTFEKIILAPISSDDVFNSFGCVWADFDNDHDMDLFVINGDGQTNNMYSNNGDGTFSRVLIGPQVQYLADNRGCSVADVDNDGDLDIFVTSFNDRNKMYINNGTGSFTEIYNQVPVSDYRPSVSSVFGDFNNDGWIDLYVTNEGPNQLFLNQGNLNFEEIDFGVGVYEDQTSAGVAAADYNLDGKLDLVISNDGKNMLLKNGSTLANHWLGIQLKGTECNTSAIGAKILLRTTVNGTPIWQKREISGQTGYQGQNSLIAHFGLGPAPLADSLIVIWPGGHEYDTTAVAADQYIIITEKAYSSPTVHTDTSLVTAGQMVTLYATINPNGIQTTAEFEYGTDTNYGSVIDALPHTLYGDTSQVVSTEIGPLTTGTYHFRISASNDRGTSKGKDAIFQVTPAEPGLILEDAFDVSVRSATLRGKINPHGIETSVFFVVNINGSLTKIPYFNNPVNGSSFIVVSTPVSGLDPNTAYPFFLQAENTNGTYKTSEKSFTTLSYPASIQISADINFPTHNQPSDYQPTDYRLIGMPGNDAPRIEDVLPGSHQTNWDCYWDNGNPTDDYFLPFNDSDDNFRFHPGRGFWIIASGNINFNNQVNSVILNEDSQFEIPLHDGWNIISNPFNEALSWDEVVAANPDNLPPIFRYNGSFATATKFLPFVGYYFMNNNNRSTINIPYPTPSSALPKATESLSWKINIQLQTDKINENCTYFGMAEDALTGQDRYDFNKPRALESQSGISFHHPEWNERYPDFASDIRPDSDKKQCWEFRVQGHIGKSVTLTFGGVQNVPASLSVYLLDAEHGTAKDLKRESTYSFILSKPETKLQIIIGSKQDIQNEIDAVIPQTFRLESNYPNPFNPQTAIPIALPKESDIRLEVFNILGKHIQTLHRGMLNSGRHVFIWNGRNTEGRPVPSGIYFYQVTLNNDKRVSKKMVLMK